MAMVKYAFRTLFELERIKTEEDLKFEMRVGLHTGPCIGGVIGRLKPRSEAHDFLRRMSVLSLVTPLLTVAPVSCGCGFVLEPSMRTHVSVEYAPVSSSSLRTPV